MRVRISMNRIKTGSLGIPREEHRRCEENIVKFF